MSLPAHGHLLDFEQVNLNRIDSFHFTKWLVIRQRMPTQKKSAVTLVFFVWMTATSDLFMQYAWKKYLTNGCTYLDGLVYTTNENKLLQFLFVWWSPQKILFLMSLYNCASTTNQKKPFKFLKRKFSGVSICDTDNFSPFS